MDINERRQQLLKIIRTASIDVPITVKKLSELLRVSVRTVHSDLDMLEGELAKEDLQIVRKSRKGIWLEGTSQERLQGGGGPGGHILSPKERRDRIILALLSGEKQSVDGLAKSWQRKEFRPV